MNCSRTLYNVERIRPPNCASDTDTLTIAIHNSGERGISSFQIETTNGFVSLGGVEPGQTTCRYPIKPFYSYPAYMFYILMTNGEDVSYKAIAVDHIGDTLYSAGHYVLTIHADGPLKELTVERINIQQE